MTILFLEQKHLSDAQEVMSLMRLVYLEHEGE